MILTEEQAKARIESSENLINRLNKEEEPTYSGIEKVEEPKEKIVTLNPRAAHAGYYKHLASEDRIEVAARARIGEPQKKLMAEFGVSQHTVSVLAKGQDYFGRGRVDEAKVQDRMNEIQDVALCKLMKTLGYLGDEKLSELGAKDLAAVAQSMAKVAGTLRPQERAGDAVAQVIIYAPETRPESKYQVVSV